MMRNMVGTHLRTSAWILSSIWAAPSGHDSVEAEPLRMRIGQSAEIDRLAVLGSQPVRPKFDTATATEMLIEAHNRIRKRERLSTLEPSRRLQEAALVQARDMAKTGKMSHTGNDGSSISDRAAARGYAYRRIGENVAFGDFSIDQVMDGWMKSEVHRKNILGGFTQIGAAVAHGKDGTPFWCVTFGLPKRK